MNRPAESAAFGLVQRGRASAPYRPIRDYALIGDCHGAALVAADGSIDWCCLGRFDADPVFWRILDAAKGGFFHIHPKGEYEAERAYVPHTNILRTTFRTAAGRVALTDFMPVGRAPGAEANDYVDLDAPGWLVRVVEGLEGHVPLRVQFKSAAADFAGTSGVAEARLIADSGDAFGDLDSLIEIAAGDTRTFIVSPKSQDQAVALEYAGKLLSVTRAFWEEWLKLCCYEGPYRDAVYRSALALKLMSFAPSGGIVAAPTTSLPEQPGGERNWDYRFSWLRDSSLVLNALAPLGYSGEARRFCEFQRLCCVETLPGLRIMYGIGGETELPERNLDHIEGYLKSRPVRTGNAAYCQQQIDIYGEVLDWLYILRKLGEPSDATQERIIREVADYVVAHWEEPDQGLWEMRAEPRHHVHSKLMSWVALDRALRLNGANEAWSKARDAVLAAVLEQGVDPEGGYLTQAFGFRQTDASLLLTCSLDLPLDKELILRTTEAVEKELREGDYVRRYLTRDGLPGSEGAFLICSFWLVDALLFAGRADEARALFERLVAKSNDLGLYAEEIDPATEAFLGNFPQGFTHLALINSALRLLLHEKGGEAALHGSYGERTRRASEATGGARTLAEEPPRRRSKGSSPSEASILPAFWRKPALEDTNN
jgi:GH15 family glucan-1,4-alpha-glucosidase